MESFGWAVAALLFVLLIVRDAARDLVQRLLAAAVAALERRFSGSRWVRARSLRRYRRHVSERLDSVPVPFQLPVDIPMCDVYIPLRAADQPESTPSTNPVDLAAAVAERRHVLVLGPPGSGKSLFLRYLHWSSCSRASEADGGNSPLAVPVPLSRLADSQDVAAEITAAFARHDFPNAAQLVQRELRRDTTKLVVLFDGLDEVSSQKRADVAKLLGDFSQQHPAVRFVVACRTQVYSGTLDGVVDKVFYVQPFTDELVERFLHAWPAMSSREAVDRLVVALRDTPRVALLVRNPLLLTMLAYLYSREYGESTELLPHNRAHFYRDASDLLLRRWQERHNRYRWEAKKVVLQHLALVNQDSRSDRRGMGFEEVLAEIQAVLPRVNVAPDEAADVLDEIVERSGLLMRLDGGERYQFAHLTMQEYFAAIELYDRAQDVLRRYQADPDAWGEPLKLWCGSEQDSTEVISSLAGTGDELLALECLADATRVDEAFAERLIDSMKGVLTGAPPSLDRDHHEHHEGVIGAFGFLASDRRPRGRGAFDYLVEELRSPGAKHRRRIALALSASNLPEAADALAELAVDSTELFSCLERMGNVAVPALAGLAWSSGGRRAGDLDVPACLCAVSSLARIGTPRAAQALAKLLWHEDHGTARRAAVALAQLTTSPAVEDALAVADLPARATAAHRETTDWLWLPFAADRTDPDRRRLLRIFGRCRALLDDLTDDDVAAIDRPLDQRLVVAVLFFLPDGGERPRDLTWMTSRNISMSDGSIPITQEEIYRTAAKWANRPEERLDLARVWTNLAGPISERRGDPRFVTLLRPDLVRRLVTRLLSDGPHPVRDWLLPRDWQTMNEEEQETFSFDGSFAHLMPLITVLLLAAAATPFAIQSLLDASGREAVASGLLLISLLAGVLFAVVPGERHAPELSPFKIWDNAADAFIFCTLSPLVGCIALLEPGRFRRRDTAVRAVLAVAAVGFTPSWMYGLMTWLNPPGLPWVATVSVLPLTTLVLVLAGRRKTTVRRNPLHGLFAQKSE